MYILFHLYAVNFEFGHVSTDLGSNLNEKVTAVVPTEMCLYLWECKTVLENDGLVRFIILFTDSLIRVLSVSDCCFFLFLRPNL